MENTYKSTNKFHGNKFPMENKIVLTFSNLGRVEIMITAVDKQLFLRFMLTDIDSCIVLIIFVYNK